MLAVALEIFLKVVTGLAPQRDNENIVIWNWTLRHRIMMKRALKHVHF